jgi:segregation and condensation protein A
MVRVSVREHLAIITEKLIRVRSATFRALCADCQSTLEVVARFLALLELYREGLVSFDQDLALGELIVHWTGPDDTVKVELAIDEYGDEEPKDPDDPGDLDELRDSGSLDPELQLEPEPEPEPEGEDAARAELPMTGTTDSGEGEET